MIMEIIGIATYAMDVMMVVDALPAEDGFATVKKVTLLPGGSGAYVLVQAARLGAHCRFMGKVGDDRIGDGVVASLRAEGIDTAGVRVKKGGVSLSTTIVVDEKGRKFILLNMGDAFPAFGPAEIDRRLFAPGCIYYSDLLPCAAAREGFRLARGAGMKTAFNLQAGLETMAGLGVTREILLDTLRDVDLFAPCREGLYALCGTQDPTRCLAFLRPYFAGSLVLTMGGEGAVAFDPQDRLFRCPARPVKVVDTTGAGDSFMGALLVAYLGRGASLAEALRYASVCASETCTALGARSSPRVDRVKQILERGEENPNRL